MVKVGNESTFTPSLIRPQVTYYWQVIASDGKSSTTGPLWSFIVEPGAVPGLGTTGNQRLPDGQFKFQFNGFFGQNYAIEGTTNLVDWLSITNFNNTNGVVDFLDQAATNLQRRFYRVIER